MSCRREIALRWMLFEIQLHIKSNELLQCHFTDVYIVFIHCVPKKPVTTYSVIIELELSVYKYFGQTYY